MYIRPVRFGLSATSQQYFSLRTNQPPTTSQQYFSLRTNQHQPSATSQTNSLIAWPTSYKDFNSNSNKNLEHFAKYRAPDEFGSSN
jgi:hypothetical protein